MDQLNDKDLDKVAGGLAGQSIETKNVTVKGNLSDICELTGQAILKVLHYCGINSSNQQDNQIMMNKLLIAANNARQSGEDPSELYTAHVTFLPDGHIEDINLTKGV